RRAEVPSVEATGVDKGSQRRAEVPSVEATGVDKGDNFFLLPITYYLFPMPNAPCPNFIYNP
ncbi:hypothetical protein, partial [Tolypothrix sp. VBCCA 56010]|uniref:hypothetical protein n=1 Tax=Tolypothrix sp. VBCCA 56010 TaxID=3137731 RepID=UPI003D7DBB98